MGKDDVLGLKAVREWLFSPISASSSNYNPRNTSMYSCGYNFRLSLRGVGPTGRRLDLGKNISFSDSLLGFVIGFS